VCAPTTRPRLESVHVRHDMVGMPWSTVNFGKYAGKGKSLPQIVFHDPDWFFWAIQNDAFPASLKPQAKDIAAKAKKIKIPGEPVGTSKVRYFLDPLVHKLANVDVVPASRPPHVGSSPTRESPYFDLSMARRIWTYDKTGGRFIVQAIKYHVFGSSKTRLTKEKCEGFFDDDSNFD
jgi:hypothetical protein